MKLALRPLKRERGPVCAGVSGKADEADLAVLEKQQTVFSYSHWKELPLLGWRDTTGLVLTEPARKPTEGISLPLSALSAPCDIALHGASARVEMGFAESQPQPHRDDSEADNKSLIGTAAL